MFLCLMSVAVDIIKMINRCYNTLLESADRQVLEIMLCSIIRFCLGLGPK